MSRRPLDVLSSLPSYGGPTILHETGEVAHWWSLGGETELRIVDSRGEPVETVPTGDVEFDGWERILWTGDRFVISGRPETYLLERDGSMEELLPEDEYTRIHDVDPEHRRVLYVHYGDEWTLRLYDREDDDHWVVSEDPEQGYNAGFSRNGRWIAYRRNPTDEFGAGSLVVADYDGDREREFNVAAADRRTFLHDWHPDGDHLLVSDRTSDTFRVGMYDWRTDAATWFGDTVYTEYGIQFSPDGERALAERHRDGLAMPVCYRVDDGAGRELEVPAGVVGTTDLPREQFFSDTGLYLGHQSATRPPRLLRYDLETDDSTVLVDTRTDSLEAVDLAEAEYVRYESADGLAVGGVLYDSGKRPSPAVVVIHGGPTSSETRDFDPFAQFLANHGYTVLQPNYRGSTEHGRAFERAIRGDVGGGEVEDVASGARWLAEQEWIDGDRIAAYGHSHGGYNAGMQAVRFSDHYRLVVVCNGYLEFGGEDPNAYARRRMIEDLEAESREEVMRRRSAIRRADEITCPVGLIYGSEDAVEVATEFADALEDRGWSEGEEFQFEVIEDEGHVIYDEERQFGLVADWLKQYVEE